jgi:hypothetical protein
MHKSFFALSRWVSVVSAMVAVVALTAPVASQAKVATLNDMYCTNIFENITPADEFDPTQRSAENYQVFWYYIAIDDTCHMELSFDEMPLMVFVSGGAMTLESNWTRDLTALTAAIDFTARPIQQVDAEVENSFGDGETLTTVAFIWAPDDGTGPDANVAGAWVATDFQEYQLISDETRLGAQVDGDEGDAGLFAMYLPATVMTAMGENHPDYVAGDFDASADMAVYLGDQEQTDQTLTTTDDGGAFLQFSPTISAEFVVDEGSDDSQDTSSVAAAGGLTVKVTAGPRTLSQTDGGTIQKGDMIEKQLKTSSVKLKWPAITGVDRYVVQVRACKHDKKAKCSTSKQFAKMYRQFKQVKKASKLVKALTASTYYQWRVKGCVAGSGCADFSAWKRFKTKS